MRRRKFVTAAELKSVRDGKRLSIAGLVLIRQRPGSAKGVCFITLEDETGVANLVIWPDVFDKQRKIVMGARLMAVHGIVQSDAEDGVIHVVARRLEDHTPCCAILATKPCPRPSTRAMGREAGARPLRAIPATSKSSPKAAIFIEPQWSGNDNTDTAYNANCRHRPDPELPRFIWQQLNGPILPQIRPIDPAMKAILCVRRLPWQRPCRRLRSRKRRSKAIGRTPRAA